MLCLGDLLFANSPAFWGGQLRDKDGNWLQILPGSQTPRSSCAVPSYGPRWQWHFTYPTLCKPSQNSEVRGFQKLRATNPVPKVPEVSLPSPFRLLFSIPWPGKLSKVLHMPRTLISYVEDTPWFPSYKLHSLNPKQTFLLKSQTTGLVLFISLIKDTKWDTPEVNPPRNALQFLHLLAGNHELVLPPTCSSPATSSLGLVYDVKRQSSPSCIPCTTSSLEGPQYTPCITQDCNEE